jgi:hypothetical protein
MNQRHEQDEEPSSPRRRRLDELFADEPFLSPTMKARRLHEKLNERLNEPPGDSPNDASRPTQGLPSEAFVRSVPEWPTQPAASASPGLRSASVSDAAPVSLIDAAIFLRSKGKQAPRTVSIPAQEKLAAFRDATLTSWVKAVEDR